MPIKNLSGQKFGSLTALSYAGSDKNQKALWLCSCGICGNTKQVLSGSLTSGRVIACGCQMGKHTIYSSAATEMIKSRAPTYNSYMAMKKRCLDSNNKSYSYYGGRGIKVCDRWLGSFQNFLTDMGERIQGTTLDRIDTNGNYSPENCKWSTSIEQRANRRDVTAN